MLGNLDTDDLNPGRQQTLENSSLFIDSQQRYTTIL